MAGNKEILDLPPVPSPDGGYLYLAKGGVDYRVPVGGAFSLLYTDATGTAPMATIPDLPASKITSGTFADAQIAAGNVTQHQAALSIAWGQLTSVPAFATRWPTWSEVTSKPATFTPSAHTHAAADVTSGTFADARIPSLDAGKITTGTFANARIAVGNVTQHQASLSIAWSQLTGVPTYVTTNTTQTITGAKTFTDLDVTGNFGRKNANSATITDQPRIFVQSSDPGAAAAENDIWLW